VVVVLEVSSKGAGVMVPQRSLGVITTQGRYIEVYRTVGNVSYRIVSDQPSVQMAEDYGIECSVQKDYGIECSVQKIYGIECSVQKITALNVAYRTWREKVEKIRNVAA
jgi:hypothetical protein